jgi:hypothetical protein
MPLVASPWNNSPGFPHDNAKGNMYEHRTNEVAELNELSAEDRIPELGAETRLELEGDDERRRFA